MRILFIGNSHTKSLQYGWQKVSENFSDISACFVGFGSMYFAGFYVDAENGVLRHPDEFVVDAYAKACGNDGSVNLDAFDCCVIVGGFQWWAGIDRRLYSKQVINAALIRFIQNTHSSKLLEKIRKISNIPAILTHAPFLATEHLEVGLRPTHYAQEVEWVNTQHLYHNNAQLLTQPRSTYDKTMQTRHEFAVGIRTTHRPDPDAPDKKLTINDLDHMNANFGKIFINEIIGNITAA